jgi:hypothetical protein
MLGLDAEKGTMKWVRRKDVIPSEERNLLSG